MIKHSYDSNDVVMLLTDLTGVMKEMSAEEREKAIQSGVHYSEMLPKEKEPSEEYMTLYENALKEKSKEIARETAEIAKMIANIEITSEGKNIPVILSLARAGIPIGVLVKRYLKFMGIDAPHFAISIIRDKGIDVAAMDYIYDYCKKLNIAVDKNIVFIDGWTGKGVIKKQVEEAVAELKKDEKWKNLCDDLYVLADPANITPYCGTHEDYMLPSACLNSTCAGLISRTILNSHIKPGQFHGAVRFDKFAEIDKSKEFVDTVSADFNNIEAEGKLLVPEGKSGMDTIMDICEKFEVKDYKKVKPGIGETTRVLLRRIPHMVLINESTDINDPDIAHILVLCKEKNIPVERYALGNYKVCGIIKELADA